MKFKTEKNLKIVNELITYFHTFGNSNVHIDLSSDGNTSYFTISGEVESISQKELDNLNSILSIPRQHEVEQYYWNLGGECEFDSELSLVGMMINKAKVTYIDNILTIRLVREEN